MLRTAVDEVIAGHELGSESRMTRGWKLFMLLPRLLLHPPSWGGMVPRKKVGGKDHLVPRRLVVKVVAGELCHQATSRRRRNQVDSLGQTGEQGFISGPIGGVVCSKGVIGRSRGGTRNIDGVAGTDQPRMPNLQFKTGGAESRDCAK